MSNLVFPQPIPSQWSWKWPIKKTPVYSTIVQTPVSGRSELRVPLYVYPRWQFDLDVSYIKGDFQNQFSPFATLLGFWMQVNGASDDWLYLDPYDQIVANHQFGTGDSSTVAFQLSRNIGGGSDIIQNVNGTPVIFNNGVFVPANQYSIGSTGVVTFGSAPADGAILSWSGSFYFRCRFNKDAYEDLQEDLYQIWSLQGLKFISVIL